MKLKLQKQYWGEGLGLKSQIVLLAALSVNGVVYAEESETDAKKESLEADKIVVSATRLDQELDEVSRSVEVVEREELDLIQPKSIAQSLRYLPNVTVSNGPRAASQAVNIRGLEGNRVLQTIDGTRQGFESGHRPSYFLDPAFLKQVEVVKGPSSMLWGSGALGGVVAQQTIEAEDLVEGDNQIGGFVKGLYNNNNHEKGGSGAVAGRSDNIDWLIGAYHRDTQDIELGNGDDLAGSAARDLGKLAKLNWQIDDAQSLRFNLRQFESDSTVPNNGAAALNGTSVFLIDRETQIDNASVEHRYEGDSDLLNSQVLLYQHTTEIDETRQSDGRFDNTELKTVGFNINNISYFGETSLLYGVDASKEEFDATRGGTNRPTPPDGERSLLGAFVQANIGVTDTVGLEVGARYDKFEMESDAANQKRDDSEVSPSVAVNWQATEWLKMTARHDQAFRAPSAEELFSTGPHFCLGPTICNEFQATPDLDSETAKNTELLASMDFVDLPGGATLKVDAAIFENKVDDFIQQIVTAPSFFPPPASGGNTFNQNVDKATLKGYELRTDLRLNNLQWVLSYGETRGEDDESKEDLTNIPADTFTTDMNYRFANEQFLLGVRAIHAGNQDKTEYAENTSGTTYDRYSVTDIYAKWSPSSVEGLDVNVTVNNIDDRLYRRAWSELDEAGREVIVSAKYAF